MSDKQPKSSTDRVKALERQRQRDYRSVFGSEAGQRVLADLAKACYLMDSTFSENPYLTAVHEGSRRVMLHIHSIMQLDFEKLMALQQRLQDNQEEEI